VPLRGTLEPKQPGKICFVGQHDLFFAWYVSLFVFFGVVDYLFFVLVYICLYTIYPDFKDLNLWHDSWTGFICNDKFHSNLGYIATFFPERRDIASIKKVSPPDMWTEGFISCWMDSAKIVRISDHLCVERSWWTGEVWYSLTLSPYRWYVPKFKTEMWWYELEQQLSNRRFNGLFFLRGNLHWKPSNFPLDMGFSCKISIERWPQLPRSSSERIHRLRKKPLFCFFFFFCGAKSCPVGTLRLQLYIVYIYYIYIYIYVHHCFMCIYIYNVESVWFCFILDHMYKLLSLYIYIPIYCNLPTCPNIAPQTRGSKVDED